MAIEYVIVGLAIVFSAVTEYWRESLERRTPSFFESVFVRTLSKFIDVFLIGSLAAILMHYYINM